ncbi:hypothetical protein, partial [Olsenella uli]|uniref:hypothetical protein n=1 Tax=Olsenella uli TaxID=133926 RepID=UPI001957FBE5
GTCFKKYHYMADVSKKLGQSFDLIEKWKYFIINRPRQYGKTTTMNILVHKLREIVFSVSKAESPTRSKLILKTR